MIAGPTHTTVCTTLPRYLLQGRRWQSPLPMRHQHPHQRHKKHHNQQPHEPHQHLQPLPMRRLRTPPTAKPRARRYSWVIPPPSANVLWTYRLPLSPSPPILLLLLERGLLPVHLPLLMTRHPLPLLLERSTPHESSPPPPTPPQSTTGTRCRQGTAKHTAPPEAIAWKRDTPCTNRLAEGIRPDHLPAGGS